MAVKMHDYECIYNNFAKFWGNLVFAEGLQTFQIWRIGCPFEVNNNVVFQRFLRPCACGADFSKRFWPVVVTFFKVKKSSSKRCHFFRAATHLYRYIFFIWYSGFYAYQMPFYILIFITFFFSWLSSLRRKKIVKFHESITLWLKDPYFSSNEPCSSWDAAITWMKSVLKNCKNGLVA